MDLALKFYTMFAGLDRAHGTYHIPDDARADAKGKIKGKAKTLQEPVTVELWAGHLAGAYPLGIVPIRDDATCVFGAIDVDVYPLDPAMLIRRCDDMGIPVVLCRTKSGGAHLYLFTRAPVPAVLMRQKLTQWRDALGYGPRIVGGKNVPGSEIFPKQDRLIEKSDTGNWINMPYFGGTYSTRYAVGKRSLSMEEFIAYWERDAVADANALQAIEHNPIELPVDDEPVDIARAADTRKERAAPPKFPPVEHPLLPGGPPCLTRLATDGFPSGARNNGLFNLGVYAKKRLPDGQWQEEIRKLARILTPSQKRDDVEPLIRTLTTKTYGYKCKDEPICGVCDKKVCITRDYGVGGGASIAELELAFGRMDKVMTKPVIWLWEIDGELVDFETEGLMNQKMFQARVMEVLNLWPATVKPFMWRDFVQATVQNATSIEVPDDATADGQVWDYLTRFCTSRVAGKNLDELLLGKPFTDDKRSYFVASDVVAYLIQHRFPNRINERLLYLALRDRDLRHHRSSLKGKELSYWSVPGFIAQTQEHAVPTAPPQEAM